MDAVARVRRLQSLGTLADPAPEPDAKEPAPAEPQAVTPENAKYYYLTGSTPRTTVADMSLQRRRVNQHRVAYPVAHVLFWAPSRNICGRHFKDGEREASYWYLATRNFKLVRICVVQRGRTSESAAGYPQKPEIIARRRSASPRQSTVHTSHHTLRDAFASRYLIELD